MNQFNFDFDPPGEASAKPSQPSKARKPRAKSPVSVAPALTQEQMAQQLEQHPDYRILRRLVPVLDYGPRVAAPDAGDTPAGTLRVLVLDTETTGLSHATDKIIELAMLLVQVDAATGLPFGVVETFEGFEDPGMPIPEAARQVTGITDDMVRGQSLAQEQVESLLARADLVVAHNAGFDRPFVEARFPGLARKAWACSFMDIDWKAQGAASAKLSALAQDQGWFYDAHRALVDCHALLQVLSERLAKGDATGLGRLIAAAAQPSFKLRATGSPFETKDKLKERGYRWDADTRVWACTLASEDLVAAEMAWLKAEVYGNRRAQVELESLDGPTRYSLRPGTTSIRSV